MHEDQLSPRLGRLIDSAKNELSKAEEDGAAAQVVALLVEDGSIIARSSRIDTETGECGAAESALAAYRHGRGGEIDAAAIAAYPHEESVFPCTRCRDSLAEIDPDLPLVIMQAGRWVFLPLSSLCETS